MKKKRIIRYADGTASLKDGMGTNPNMNTSALGGMLSSLMASGGNPYAMAATLAPMIIGGGIEGMHDITTALQGKKEYRPISQNTSLSYGMGGVVANVEGNEVVEDPTGQITQYKGNSHEEGGIDAYLRKGSKIFSDRIDLNDKSMQERKMRRERLLAKLEKAKTIRKGDSLTKATYNRMKSVIDMEDNLDLIYQGAMKDKKAPTETFAYGGVTPEDNPFQNDYFNPEVEPFMSDLYWTKKLSQVNPLLNNMELNDPAVRNYYRPTVGIDPNPNPNINVNALKVMEQGQYNTLMPPTEQFGVGRKDVETPYPIVSGGDRLLTDQMYSNNFKREKPGWANRGQYTEGSILNPMPSGADRFPMPDLITSTTPKRDISKNIESIQNLGKEEDTNPFSQYTTGDILGMSSTAFGAFAPLLTTIANRLGDKTEVNSMKDYGTQGLRTQRKAGQYITQQRDKNLMDVMLSKQSAMNSNRNTARGVNTLRALDIANQSNSDNAVQNIYSTFAAQMMQHLGQTSALQDKRDEVVMTGEDVRRERNVQNRDNYFTQLNKDFSNISTIGQKLGSDLNKSQSDQDFLSILPD